ncbi:MAG: FecR family protein [Sideroxydans sp.]
MIKKILWSLVLLLVATPAYAEASGKIGYMSGALVAQRPDGTVKVMGPKAEVSEGDLLVTAKDSYAQVVMNDGTKMTMRPNSNLKIESFKFKQNEPQADAAVFRLLKGGFRTVTGLIGKRGNKDAYKLRAATATIGIRGTDFTSRLCATKDCADDGDAKPVPPPAPQLKAVGRVMLIQGELAAKDKESKARKLNLGSPVYEGDVLQSSVQTHAVVAFRDGSRITLQANSVFHIEAFSYDKKANQENAALRLIKGGVRVVTGLIGRVNHDNYKFRVSAATIGIRGTGFDAWCNGPCADGSNNPQAAYTTLWSQYAELRPLSSMNDAGSPAVVWAQVAEADTGAGNPLNGAGVYVWQGEVVFASAGSSFTVALNQAATLARETGKPIQIMSIPSSITNNTTPRPDSVNVDLEKLFEESASDGEPGLYVTVHDGQVILSKGEQKVDLGKGESGFSSEQLLTRLSVTPGFMGGDSKLDNIERGVDGKSGIGGSGCVVVP